MAKEFEMTDIGLMSYYLGIKVKQGEDGIFISQEGYAKEVLKKFNMNDANPVGTPMECGVKINNRFMEEPTATHYKMAKRILRYIKGTIRYGLSYVSSSNFDIVGYCDSDWSSDLDDRKSTTGFVFFIGETAFTWM
ncbi:uncharacterized mitochondrial protein AtMg00810-like [Benincasa hispida]|uniref:uncharacterized mitochondrial protein AtMg00810-like n=1 Tax=Benincasa hispida TaxID=102211 RepID=UPI0019021CC0|nr:uncharacterized mitochondrial protein AtMg00810-like [Benincasa hispida]